MEWIQYDQYRYSEITTQSISKQQQNCDHCKTAIHTKQRQNLFIFIVLNYFLFLLQAYSQFFTKTFAVFSFSFKIKSRCENWNSLFCNIIGFFGLKWMVKDVGQHAGSLCYINTFINLMLAKPKIYDQYLEATAA